MTDLANQGGPRLSYKFLLQVMCMALGYFPPEKLSVAKLKLFLRRAVAEIARKHDNAGFRDPEIPSDYLNMIYMVLPTRGIPDNDISQVVNHVYYDQGNGFAPAGGYVAGPDGQLANVSQVAASADSWAQNTAEWWENTISGDWESGWINFQQGWNDFWSGNFF